MYFYEIETLHTNYYIYAKSLIQANKLILVLFKRKNLLSQLEDDGKLSIYEISSTRAKHVKNKNKQKSFYDLCNDTDNPKVFSIDLVLLLK